VFLIYHEIKIDLFTHLVGVIQRVNPGKTTLGQSLRLMCCSSLFWSPLKVIVIVT